VENFNNNIFLKANHYFSEVNQMYRKFNTLIAMIHTDFHYHCYIGSDA